MTPLTLFQGDAAQVLGSMDPDSVDLCVTSPPYDSLRNYGGFQFDFKAIAAQLFRVIKPGRVLCWNVGDQVVDGSETLTSFRQAIHFTDEVGFRMHDTMIYAKVNFSHPETTRYHQMFEYLFVLSKGSPDLFNPIKDKRNLYGGKRGGLGINTFTEKDGSKSLRNVQHNIVAEFGMRGNVWCGNSRGQEDPCGPCPHPAMMPRWLARDLILSWSNPGENVLDPLAGSGTVGVEALKSGRRTILIDSNPEYIEMIRQNCHVTPGFAL